MADIGLEIFGPDRTSNTLEAPEDMNAGDFQAEIVENLGLQGEGWRIFDKDLGRELDPRVTLAANGVSSGHHLYFRRVEPVPLPVDVGRVAPSPLRWVIPAVVALSIGLAAGYVLRGTMRDPQVDGLRQQLLQSRRNIDILTKELGAGARTVDERSQALTAKLDAKTAEAQAFEQQLEQSKKDLFAARKRITEMLAKDLQSAAQITQLRDQADQLRARSEGFDAETAKVNHTVQGLQTENARLNSLLAAARKQTPPPNAQPEIGMVIWSGKVKGKQPVEISGKAASVGEVIRGALPTVPFYIYQGDPERVDIRQAPNQSNQYRLIFARKNNGDATTIFFWVLAR
jgi:hypothetical protein